MRYFANLGEHATWKSNEVTIKSSDDLTDEQKAAVQSIEATYDGSGRPVVKVKLHVKGRALDSLGKYLCIDPGSVTIVNNTFIAARRQSINELGGLPLEELRRLAEGDGE